jgi:hypothetical protein
MTTTTQERDDTMVPVAGAGLIRFRVLAWMKAAERFGVRFRIEGGRLEHEPGEFGDLPEPAQAFVAQHADELRRVVLATPARVM